MNVEDSPENKKIDSGKAETLARWYLRFNGYFTVDSFTVHATDPANRIYEGEVRDLTEVDILGIRHKFNQELPIEETILKNDEKLLHKDEPVVDFIITEVKTGNEKRLNKFWRRKNDANKIPQLVTDIEYILRFAGFIQGENEINTTAKSLAEHGSYLADDKSFGVRLVLISEKKANKNWKLITNVLIDDIIKFIVKHRNCWIDEGQVSSSIHIQWDELIKEIFIISNNEEFCKETKKEKIKELLQED